MKQVSAHNSYLQMESKEVGKSSLEYHDTKIQFQYDGDVPRREGRIIFTSITL